MSKLQTTTSTTRPASPPTGTLLHETDTNRIILWDGTQYHVYNRDSLIQTTGGVDELHYPQGIYADSSATYYVGTSPLLHFDTSHMNGLDKTQVYGHGVWPEYWYDRTQNRYEYREAYPNVSPVMDLNKSSALSGGSNTMPCIHNNAAYYTPTASNTAPTTITGDATTFAVLQPNNTNRYSSLGSYSHWYTNNAKGAQPGVYFHMGMNFSSNLGANPNAAWSNTGETSWTGWYRTVDAGTGPGLYIGRNSDLGNQIWRPDSRGNYVPITVSKSTTTCDINNVLWSYDQFAWEIIIFDSALSITELNKVKSYLQNKYEGLNADFFPSGGTIDLTE